VRGEGRFFDGGGDRLILLLLCAFLEVFLRVVEKLEEVRCFSCSKASDGRAILVWMIFAGKLPVADLDFGLRRSESESKNHK
jgi:hypothetical protein